MAVPILSKRRNRKNAELATVISDAVGKEVEKAISPAVAMASQMSSGATYPVGFNQSSPFNQVGPGQGFIPLPRPPGTFDSGFGPADPLWPDAIDAVGPDGRTMPRRAQYLIAANLQLIDRRLPWSVLKGLAEDVDVIARCIQIVQDAIVGLNWSWGFSEMILNQIMEESGETNSAKANALARAKYGDELQRVSEFFDYPDKRMGFSLSQWLTDIIYSHLVYDGIVIYPQYNLGGELMSLSTIDTATIKILLDNQGFLPRPPAPSYQQILYGFPRGEYQAEDVNRDGDVPNGFRSDQLAYYIRRPHPSSVYGYSQVEECVNIATIYMQRQAWLHAEYTYGVTPKMMIETEGTETWTPEQLGYYQQILNDQLSGQTQRRQQFLLLRSGMKGTQLKSQDEIYKSDYDAWLVMQMGAKFGIPQAMLGIQMHSSIGGGAAGKQQSNQSEQFATDALKNFLIDCINDMARRFLGVGPELTITATGAGDDDDETQQATSDSVLVGAGIYSRNEIRAKRGSPLIDEPEADQLGVTTGTGVTFLQGQLEAQAQELDAQAAGHQMAVQMAANGQVPGQPSQPNEENGNDGQSGPPNPPNGPAKPGNAPAATPKPSANNDDKAPNVSAKDDPRQPDTDAAEKELAAFSKFAKSRLQDGRGWRTFDFRHQEPVRGRQLNAAGESGDWDAIQVLLEKKKSDSNEAVIDYSGRIIPPAPLKAGDKVVIEHKNGKQDELDLEDIDDLAEKSTALVHVPVQQAQPLQFTYADPFHGATEVEMTKNELLIRLLDERDEAEQMAKAQSQMNHIANVVKQQLTVDFERLEDARERLMQVELAKRTPEIHVNVPSQAAPVVHVDVDATSTHEHHVEAPIVHMAPEINVTQPDITVNVPKAPKPHVVVAPTLEHGPQRSTVKRNEDGTISIERE